MLGFARVVGRRDGSPLTSHDEPARARSVAIPEPGPPPEACCWLAVRDGFTSCRRAYLRGARWPAPAPSEAKTGARAQAGERARRSVSEAGCLDDAGKVLPRRLLLDPVLIKQAEEQFDRRCLGRLSLALDLYRPSQGAVSAVASPEPLSERPLIGDAPRRDD